MTEIAIHDYEIFHVFLALYVANEYFRYPYLFVAVMDNI
jgi:hypothetical protein